MCACARRESLEAIIDPDYHTHHFLPRVVNYLGADEALALGVPWLFGQKAPEEVEPTDFLYMGSMTDKRAEITRRTQLRFDS